MPIDPRIIEILARYEDAFAQSQTPSIEELCRDCPELAEEVKRRIKGLNAVPSPHGPTETPAPSGLLRAAEFFEPQAGTRVGLYRLVQRIGEGGMGSVWMAEQTEPVRRTVAVKFIKSGNNDRQFLNRFAAERQALALMDHPNIAKVLDAGTIEEEYSAVTTSRPYFVMELVKGVPITRYCDVNKLSLRQRLELFVQVCHAIQHAHQKGIIHRDIKPSNILVASYDGHAVPKVIDFGLAKATGLRLTDSSMATRFGTMIGTLEYMSPEQTDPSILDVDTRSDIFSLGVLLYELLTGTTPVTREQMAKVALHEIVRSIQEAEPPPPSSRLSQSGPKLASIAAQRDSEPARLARMVRGELDWMVMKALEKDRERRYETANAFALDVQRYLSDELVLARPPSAIYRIRKFAKRNKGILAAAAVLLIALVGGIVGTSWGLVQAQQQRDLAERARQAETTRAEGERRAKQEALTAMEAEKKANDQAQKRLAQLKKANDIVTSLFTDLDIRNIKQGSEPLESVLAERLVKTGSDLEGEAVGEPLVVAKLQQQLGDSLYSLGYPREAAKLFDKMLKTRKVLLPTDHRDTLWAKFLLARSQLEGGMASQALPLVQETFKVMAANLGEDDSDTLACMSLLATTYRQLGRPKEALPLCEKVVERTTAKYGRNDIRTLTSEVNLGTCYLNVGKAALSVSLLEDSVKVLKVVAGANHPETLSAMNTLAATYNDARKIELAVKLYEEILELRKQKLGQYHPETIGSMNNLANSYRNAKKLDLALPLMKQAVSLMKAKLGTDHRITFTGLANLALCYRDAGKTEQALAFFEEAAIGLERLRFEHDRSSMIMRDFIDCCESIGLWERAEIWQRKWLSVAKERSGAESAKYASELAILGWNLLKQRKWTEAEPILRDCLAIREQVLPDSWITFNTRSMLGDVLLGQNKTGEAEPVLVKSYEGLKQRAQSIPASARTARLTEAVQRLVALYQSIDKVEEVERWQKELAGLKKQ